MRIDVHGYGDLGVPEDVHHGPGRDVTREQQRRASVAEIVKTDLAYAGAGDEPAKGCVQVARLNRSTGRGSEHQGGPPRGAHAPPTGARGRRSGYGLRARAKAADMGRVASGVDEVLVGAGLR